MKFTAYINIAHMGILQLLILGVLHTRKFERKDCQMFKVTNLNFDSISLHIWHMNTKGYKSKRKKQENKIRRNEKGMIS